MIEKYISWDLQKDRQYIRTISEDPEAWKAWQKINHVKESRVTDPEGKTKGFLIYTGKLENVKNWIKLDK